MKYQLNIVFRWIWEHSQVEVSFDSWMKNNPNEKEKNQDDCVLMDCGSHKCDWLDVSLPRRNHDVQRFFHMSETRRRRIDNKTYYCNNCYNNTLFPRYLI